MSGWLVLYVIFAYFVLRPVLWGWRFVALFFKPPLPRASDTDCPRVAVLLPLRGADPSLARCLGGLLAQDYPHFDLYLILDSEQDSARPLVEKLLSQQQVGPKIHVSYLRAPLPSCSLKLSAQLQTLAELPAEIEVIALIDADANPPTSWLRDMIQPLHNPQVGAVSGVRWYRPTVLETGSLVRHLWNACAVTQMVHYSIPWGGSLALHARVFRRPELFAQWSRSFAEDTSLLTVLRQLGLSLHYTPAACLVNEEASDFAGTVTFVRRQLVCARLHHPAWTQVFLGNIAFGLSMVGLCVWAGAGFLLGDFVWAWACLGAVLVQSVGMLSGLYFAERAVSQQLARQRVVLPAVQGLWLWPVGIACTLVTFGYCLLSAHWLPEISWRGIRYALGRDNSVTLLDYRPYTVNPSDSEMSLL